MFFFFFWVLFGFKFSLMVLFNILIQKIKELVFYNTRVLFLFVFVGVEVCFLCYL